MNKTSKHVKKGCNLAIYKWWCDDVNWEVIFSIHDKIIRKMYRLWEKLNKEMCDNIFFALQATGPPQALWILKTKQSDGKLRPNFWVACHSIHYSIIIPNSGKKHRAKVIVNFKRLKLASHELNVTNHQVEGMLTKRKTFVASLARFDQAVTNPLLDWRIPER